MKVSNELKKSTQIRISHHGVGSALNIMTVFTTVGKYEQVVDWYTAKAVRQALETNIFDIPVGQHGVEVTVSLNTP